MAGPPGQQCWNAPRQERAAVHASSLHDLRAVCDWRSPPDDVSFLLLFMLQVSFLHGQHDISAADKSRKISPDRGRYITRSATGAAGRSRSRSHDSTSAIRRTGRRGICSQIPNLGRASMQHDSNNSSSKPMLSLLLDDREQQPAALAVIASMYCVDAVSSLQQDQLPYAVQYADLLQLDSAAEKAVGLLSAAADSAVGLQEATLAVLAAFKAWPDSMLRLLPKIAKLAEEVEDEFSRSAAGCYNHHVRRMLTATLGKLEDAWQQPHLMQMLLQLPLPAMQLLLSAGGLTLYSEDTVLYTAMRYVKAQPAGLQDETAKKLAAHVRVPALSEFQLAVHALTSDTSSHNLLREYQQSARQIMLLLRCIKTPVFGKMLWVLGIPAPRCWAYGHRTIIPMPQDGMKLVWKLPIAELKQACISCKDTRQTQSLLSPGTSPPISGTDWKIEVVCRWDSFSYHSGVVVGVYAAANLYPREVFYKYKCKVAAPQFGMQSLQSFGLERHGDRKVYDKTLCDFFGVGAMPDGWDEVAWRTKSLPVEGTVDIELSMLEVC